MIASCNMPQFLFVVVSGGFAWQLTEFIIGVFLQVLGLPFVAVAQVSLFSKITSEKTQGQSQEHSYKESKNELSKISFVPFSNLILLITLIIYCNCKVCGDDLQ